MELKIQIASVKVMRSHDYCHFEVQLSTTEATTPEQVDDLRKEAARLTDKAVAQYKIMKNVAASLMQEKLDRRYLVNRMTRIGEKPEGERTVREQAELKAYNDAKWRESRGYDYEDDWRQEDDL